CWACTEGPPRERLAPLRPGRGDPRLRRPPRARPPGAGGVRPGRGRAARGAPGRPQDTAAPAGGGGGGPGAGAAPWGRGPGAARLGLGDWLLDGREPPAEVRRRATLVFQRPLLLAGTVLFNVEYGLRLRGLGGCRRRARAALDRLGLGTLASRPARSLSGGEA